MSRFTTRFMLSSARPPGVRLSLTRPAAQSPTAASVALQSARAGSLARTATQAGRGIGNPDLRVLARSSGSYRLDAVPGRTPTSRWGLHQGRASREPAIAEVRTQGRESPPSPLASLETGCQP